MIIKKYNIIHYNLDAIIAVGYRINSKKATEFRIWATKILKEYMIKGFSLNDEFLKNNGESMYFEELLARIREIRSSEEVIFNRVDANKDNIGLTNFKGKNTNERGNRNCKKLFNRRRTKCSKSYGISIFRCC